MAHPYAIAIIYSPSVFFSVLAFAYKWELNEKQRYQKKKNSVRTGLRLESKLNSWESHSLSLDTDVQTFLSREVFQLFYNFN